MYKKCEECKYCVYQTDTESVCMAYPSVLVKVIDNKDSGDVPKWCPDIT